MKDRPQRSPTSVSLLHTIDSNPDPTLNNPFHWHTMGGGGVIPHPLPSSEEPVWLLSKHLHTRSSAGSGMGTREHG